MEIRRAVPADLDRMMELYQAARAYMARTGNPTQWPETYPPRALLEEDMELGQSYVCTEDGRICGTFVLALGEDPTYRVIEEGGWSSDRPYGTIHRLAGDGSRKGVFSACLEFCAGRTGHLRADTHRDNGTMRHLLEKHGFQRRGIIYTDNGTPRIAYEYDAEV